MESITRQVEDIGTAGSRERVPAPPTQDEIGHLARTVNVMLDRVDRSAVAQRRFVADASHELRSSLAVIRTETEVALAHPAEADWERIGRNVLDETNRLERLVTDLLLLAHADDPQGLAVMADTTITDVEEVALAEAARNRGTPVRTSGILAGRVQARPPDVERVIRHLLDSAVRHASTEVTLTVVVEHGTTGSQVVVTVDDDGEGVPEHERERIFERFARLEDSRSRESGGAGLGLSVVAATVTRIGGTVSVTSSPAGGARFTVRLSSSRHLTAGLLR